MTGGQHFYLSFYLLPLVFLYELTKLYDNVANKYPDLFSSYERV